MKQTAQGRFGARLLRAAGWMAAGLVWLLPGAASAGPAEGSPPPGLLAPAVAADPGPADPALRVAPVAPGAPGDGIAPRVRPSLGRRVLWYVPNRVLDLLDILRLRLRVGPGLAVNFRITDLGAFYAGNYRSVYAGVPGPRHPFRLRPWVGLEELQGIVLAGVDATDNTPHGPRYGAAETDLGLHVLLVGAEVGVDAVEIGDFFGGWFGFDPMEDDFPDVRKNPPAESSGIGFSPAAGVFALEPKPAEFAGLPARLDYLHLNAQRRISEPVRATDAYFANDPDAPIDVPETQFRLGLFATLRQGEDFDLELKPDVEIDVELPNLEHRLRIFVESAQNNALPQDSLGDNDESGFDIGARRFIEGLNLSFDAGVRATWPPEAFGRVTWRGDWRLGSWNFEPEQRFFYETDDKFGFRSSIFSARWLGAGMPYVLIPDASIKFTTDAEDYEWAASFKAMRVQRLLDERRRGKAIGWDDTAVSQGLRFAVYGTDGTLDTYRFSFGFRGPLYKKWIYWELDPGLEWEEEDDYDTTFVLRMGLDLLFWGQAYH